MTVLLVDGNSILNRAFYGIRPLTTKDGRLTNAIYGFLNMLQKAKTASKATCTIIAFDLKAPTFRHKKYVAYKAQRKGMPPELYSQMAPLKELLSYLGYPMVTCEGYEADDILGTLTKAVEATGGECVIATGDRDSLQLVSETTCVHLASTKEDKIYDLMKIDEEYGIAPHQLIDVKALQGDSSDNIPGVAGIGAKGALELIKAHGSIENIYDNLDTLEIKPALKLKLQAGKESAFLSYDLGTICCDAPIETDIQSYNTQTPDYPAAAALMTDLELFSLMKKIIPENTTPSKLVTATSASLTDAPAQPLQLVFVQESSKFFKALALQKQAVFYANFKDGEFENAYFFSPDTITVISSQSEFVKFLGDEDIEKKTFCSKAIYKYAAAGGIEFKNCTFDAELAAYLLNPSGSYELERLFAEYNVPSTEVNAENEGELTEEIASLASFGLLVQTLEKLIEENAQHKLLCEIEIPLARVLAKMELAG
ncbi:MAG: DNA polymerase I, partial [Oscillospiraceae bacterium]|nr:DNA polymerase I [Oscillospiraceae bacterium]